MVQDVNLSELMKGSYDLHMHTGPDVRPRKADDYEMALRFKAAGMKGFTIKSHFTSTAERAIMAHKYCPEVDVFGGVVLNNSVGGINPFVVENNGQLGAKFVWFPTFDAEHDRPRLYKNMRMAIAMHLKMNDAGFETPGIRVVDENGKLIPEASYVLELCKEYGMICSTAHISHEETFALAKRAHEIGYERLVVAHVDWKGTYYNVEEQKELVKLGATLEHCYCTPCITHEQMFAEMKEVGTEHFIMCSDLGVPNTPKELVDFMFQGEMPFADDGMKDFARMALENGISAEEIRRMIVTNPEYLLGKR